MATRRPGPTDASRARAARIAAALEGMLDELPAAAARAGGPRDPYRPPPPRRAVSRATALRCPACGARMSTDFERGLELDRCLGCSGLWLDVGELEIISAATATAPARSVGELRQRLEGHTAHMNQGPVRYRACPRCRDIMNRRNFGTISGVIIDECPRHGVFLDPEELEAIERFVELGGMALQRRGEEERLRRRELRVAQARQREPEGMSARDWLWWSVFDWFA